MPPQGKTNISYEKQDESQNADEKSHYTNNIKNAGGVINKGFIPDATGNKSTSNGTIDPPIVSDQKEIDFDELLPYLGEFGLYQKMLFLLMIPFAFFVAIVYFSQIFMTLTPEQHWCWIPELMNLTVDERRLLAIPAETSGLYPHSRCRMYQANWSQVLESGRATPDHDWEIVPCSNGWEYNFTDVPYHTIASELDWVCEQDNLAATAQAIFFCGAIFGGLVFGWIADKYGRIPALVGTNMVGFIAGVGTAFCTTFVEFCVCRFLVGLAFDNCFTMMYILVLEYVGPKWRTFVANMSIALFFTLAACLLPWIAIGIANWRTYALVISVPFILALATPWVVPESARWLVSQGKIDQAIVILKKFERINEKEIPEKVLANFTESSIRNMKNSHIENQSYSVLDLFKTPRLRNITLLLIFIWMAISLVFDGHVRNVGSLGLDTYLTFTIASATELPADTFLTLVLDNTPETVNLIFTIVPATELPADSCLKTINLTFIIASALPADTFLTLGLDKWGRRWLACGSMVVSGIFSLFAITAPAGIPTASLAILGRFAVNISYNIGLQYAAELLPTVVRAQGVALIHIMGYVASILAPFVVYLANVSQDLPLLILGTLGILGGLLCLFLPETMDKDMPQTLQDGENFGKDQKFWQFPCIQGKPGHPEPSINDPGKYSRRPSHPTASFSKNHPSFNRAVPGSHGLASRASVRASIRASMKKNKENERV